MCKIIWPVKGSHIMISLKHHHQMAKSHDQTLEFRNNVHNLLILTCLFIKLAKYKVNEIKQRQSPIDAQSTLTILPHSCYADILRHRARKAQIEQNQTNASLSSIISPPLKILPPCHVAQACQASPCPLRSPPATRRLPQSQPSVSPCSCPDSRQQRRQVHRKPLQVGHRL